MRVLGNSHDLLITTSKLKLKKDYIVHERKFLGLRFGSVSNSTIIILVI